MNGLPLHPAIVHIPLALAFLVPIGALVVAFLAWRGKLRRGAVVTLVATQAALVAGGFVAMQAGEADEERVEAVVPEAAIEAHEDGASTFVIAGAIVLGVLAAGAVLANRPTAARALLTTATAGAIAVAVLGLRVGHSGGELVYVHGAASAHVAQGGGPAAEGGIGGERASGEADRHGQAERDDDDD